MIYKGVSSVIFLTIINRKKKVLLLKTKFTLFIIIYIVVRINVDDINVVRYL